MADDKVVEIGARGLRRHFLRTVAPEHGLTPCEGDDWTDTDDFDIQKDPIWIDYARSFTEALAAAGYAIVPQDPSRGLLISMALREDHAFTAPVQELFPGVVFGLTDQQREARLRDMRKVHEEVVGTGFYRANDEAYYVGLINLVADIPEDQK